MGEEGLDWTKLPHDCVNLISRRLIDTFDFMGFRMVCKSWLNAIPLAENQPKFPLLLAEKPEESADFVFYSVMSDLSYRVHRPEAVNKLYLRQAGGYLGMMEKVGDKSSPSLLNPVTGAQLSLHHVTGSCDDFFPFCVGENPIENSDDVVISFQSCDSSYHVGYWNKTASSWVVKQDFPGAARAFYKGRVFTCIIFYGCTKVTQLEGEHEVVDIGFPDDVPMFTCLVQVEDYLLGIVERSHLNSTVEQIFFEAYKLDEEITPLRWIKVNSIGDNMVFINYRDNAFSISSSHFHDERTKGNSIYFTKWNYRWVPTGTNQIGVCQLGDNFSKILGTGPPGVSKLTWIIPKFS